MIDWREATVALQRASLVCEMPTAKTVTVGSLTVGALGIIHDEPSGESRESVNEQRSKWIADEASRFELTVLEDGLEGYCSGLPVGDHRASIEAGYDCTSSSQHTTWKEAWQQIVMNLEECIAPVQSSTSQRLKYRALLASSLDSADRDWKPYVKSLALYEAASKWWPSRFPEERSDQMCRWRSSFIAMKTCQIAQRLGLESVLAVVGKKHENEVLQYCLSGGRVGDIASAYHLWSDLHPVWT